jgi:hypothetical protein
LGYVITIGGGLIYHREKSRQDALKAAAISGDGGDVEGSRLHRDKA